MKNDEKAIEKAAGTELDARTQARVIESLVLRGDLSGLAPQDRARYYVQMCEGLGLNPSAQPFAFLRLNGKEVLYATRGATDQLAALHSINREIIDGPKIVDIAGTKVAYCVARASMTNGRSETATATLPVVDPANLYMKLETKAKRRATLSILGLGLLDEMELETIPKNVQEPGGGVDFSQLAAPRADDALDAVEVPAPLASFYARCAEIELPGEAIAVWMKHRADLSTLPGADREAAWKALCARTEEVGKMKNAKVWLKKAIAEEDARRGMGVDPGAALPGAGDPRAAPPRSALDDVRESAEARHTVRELADLWRLARADLTAAGCDAAGWKLIADRALVLGLIPGAVSAEVKRLDAQPPPDGPRGGSPAPTAPESTEAHGSAVDGTQGAAPVASHPEAWRMTREGITAHVASIGNIPRLANSARKHLGALAEPLRLHAVHVYAGRLQRLSHDGTSTLTWEACIERTETWLREGPKVADLPAHRPTAPAQRVAGVR